MNESEREEVLAHERTVVGAALADARILDDITDVVQADDFYDPRLALVFTVACELRDEGAPGDAVAVSDRLARHGDLDRVGGTSAVLDLAGTVAVPSSAAWYASRVRDASMRRAVWRAGTRMQELAASGTATTDETLAVVDGARAELDRLVTASATGEDSHADAVWASINALDDPPGDPTPWRKITKAISGWKPGALYLMGARPATGKSIGGTMAAVDMARRGKTAVLFSLEMTRTEVLHRMFVAHAEVDMGRLQNRTLTARDRDALKDAARHIAGLPLVIVDQPSVSVAQVRARVRAEQRRGTVGIVVVDYLGLLSPPAGAAKQDRRVQVDAISRGLKSLAMELRVPVLAMAQVNRGPEARQDKMPTPADLRESGGQEQDADVVMLMHRDAPREDSGDMGTTLHVFAAKNRHGPQALMDFKFEGHYSRFTDGDPVWDRP